MSDQHCQCGRHLIRAEHQSRIVSGEGFHYPPEPGAPRCMPYSEQLVEYAESSSPAPEPPAPSASGEADAGEDADFWRTVYWSLGMCMLAVVAACWAYMLGVRGLS